MDTGLCHKRGGPETRFMYRCDDLTDMPAETMMETPVTVWLATGGENQTMALRDFNAGWVVDFRFDTSRVPIRAAL